MSRKGHYSGGSTVIGPRNTSWFSFKVPKWARKKQKPSDQKPSKSKPAQPKKKAVKPARPVKKLPDIMPEPSVPHKDVIEVRQAGRRGTLGKPIVVEFAASRKRTGAAR